jgi:pectate lyase
VACGGGEVGHVSAPGGPDDPSVGASGDSTVNPEFPAAFPGARGHGALALKGCDRSRIQLLEVTSLAGSGSGTLNHALSRVRDEVLSVVVFRTGGEIVTDQVEIDRACLYVAGQTAPGDGITLRSSGGSDGPLLSFQRDGSARDVVLRYLRIRHGGGSPGQGDNISLKAGSDIVLDHLSLQWADDENLGMHPIDLVQGGEELRRVSVQNSIIAAALRPHSTGLLLGFEETEEPPVSNVSIHGNLFAHNAHRNPLIFGPVTDIEVVNNVVYNWMSRVGRTQADTEVDFVGNYYRPLGGSDIRFLEHKDHPPDDPADLWPEPSLHMSGNRSHSGITDWDLYRIYQDYTVIPGSYRRSGRLSSPQVAVSVSSASSAYSRVLAGAGAGRRLDCRGDWVDARDAVDRRMVDDVRKGTGPRTDEQWDEPSDFGGYPSVDPGTPCADGDGDGMPDAFEERYGLRPGDASDASADPDGDGYTNLEEYLNGTVPR